MSHNSAQARRLRWPLLVAAAVLLAAPGARANPEPPPIIVEIVQDGGDVRLTLEHGFEPYEEWERTLIRRNQDSAMLDPVFEDQEFSPGDPWDCDGECWITPDPGWCAANPDECVDCDGDEALECPGMCYWWCQIDVVDECVPPGEMRYTIFEWEGEECVAEEWADLLVTDQGQDCPAGALAEHDCYGGADGDGDADSDSDADSDADSDPDDAYDDCSGDYGPDEQAPAGDAGSCAVSGPGRSPLLRGLLLLLMLALGGIVLTSRP
jgi:hypothetical protein